MMFFVIYFKCIKIDEERADSFKIKILNITWINFYRKELSFLYFIYFFFPLWNRIYINYINKKRMKNEVAHESLIRQNFAKKIGNNKRHSLQQLMADKNGPYGKPFQGAFNTFGIGNLVTFFSSYSSLFSFEFHFDDIFSF